MDSEPQGGRCARELIAATRAFVEIPARSWAYLLSSIGWVSLAAAVGASPLFWPVRAASAVLEAMLLVRLFSVYHDHLHGALLRRSPIARAILGLYGLLVLSPASVWRESHDFHHAHTGQLHGSHIGAFPIMTVPQWRAATPGRRFLYRAVRHPVNVLFAMFTMFGWGMCAAPFLRAPRKHASGLMALLLHGALGWWVIGRRGFGCWAFAIGLPLFLSSAMGAYLFYAQHNFPTARLQPRRGWEVSRAALQSSSYMRMSPVMHWLTGNIGFHHVHHLNPMIPCYRLPEAMTAIAELERVGTTSLHPLDIVACFRLGLWDPEKDAMVGWSS